MSDAPSPGESTSPDSPDHAAPTQDDAGDARPAPVHGSHHEGAEHSLKTLFGVYYALMGLVVVSLVVAYIDFGILGLPVAMGIAVTKAGLILVYFMHLLHAMPLTRIFAASGFVSLAILLAIVFADYIARGGIP